MNRNSRKTNFFTEASINESYDIPLAPEVSVDNPEHIPLAKQIFDTRKLYRNWAKCCEFSMKIAHVGLKHADNLQTQATILGTVGLIIGSQSMQHSATETNRQAHETRKSTMYVSLAFLFVSVTATTLYWAVEEGLIGTIVKSISACAKYCANNIASSYSWIKEKTTNIFKRNTTVKQHNNVDSSWGLEEEEEVLDGVKVEEEQKSSSQNESHNNSRTFLPSGGQGSGSNFSVPSAPPLAEIYDQAVLNNKLKLNSN